ncbi:hypothetical protein SAMN05192573_103316 [Mucilaginibacter gossypii]|uniref:Uncharacterized protein n=1 Tax=Mucilaginibacter gossypii TaxID=551996 RepID=A0A1G7TYY0_9SPHI|nr:hypothetical protein SAMN05192573_103316 [Mucilaginibacter gossypii]
MSKKERKGYAITGTDIAGLSAAAYLFLQDTRAYQNKVFRLPAFMAMFQYINY